MTDEQMDIRLRDAGDRWRSDNAVAAAPTAAAPAAAPAADVTPPARRPGRRGLIISAALVAAALVVGGTFLLRGIGVGRTDNADHAAALEGTVWQLLGYGDRTSQRSDSTLYIDRHGNLVADDECSVLGGRAQVGDGRIRVARLTIRDRSCTDTYQPAFSGHGSEILAGGGSFSIVRDRLTISADGNAMHFAATQNLPAPTLDVPTFVGADWQLRKITDAAGHAVAVVGDPRLKVSDDRKLSATDGCNQLFGTVVGDGPVRFTHVGRTEIDCRGHQAASAVVDAVLSGQVVQIVNGAQLTLTKNGAGTLTYRWVPADDAATDPNNLADRTWHLASVAGVPTIGAATLRIDKDGTVTGSDGCEQLGGRAVVGQGTLSGAGPRTNHSAPARSCPAKDQAATVESFLDQKPALWSIRDGKLLIYGGGAQAFALVYDTTAPPPAATDRLVGRRWALTGIEHDSGNASSGSGSSGTRTYVVFDASGHITVTHPCYVNRGAAVVGRAAMDISNVNLLRSNPCPAAPEQQSEQKQDGVVDGVLNGHVTWAISDGELSLKNGATTLTFSAKA